MKLLVSLVFFPQFKEQKDCDNHCTEQHPKDKALVFTQSQPCALYQTLAQKALPVQSQHRNKLSAPAAILYSSTHEPLNKEHYTKCALKVFNGT